MKSYQMDQRTRSFSDGMAEHVKFIHCFKCWQTQLAVYSLLRITKTSNNHRLGSAGVDDGWFCWVNKS